MYPCSISKNAEFFRDKRVFITGHNGFTGTWLIAALYKLGAKVMGYAMPAAPGSAFANIRGEDLISTVDGSILDVTLLKEKLNQFQPEIVMHLASMAIVKDCFDHARTAFEINIMGTVNMLEAVRECESVKSVIIVTTNNVYENKGDNAVYSETDSLGGKDPYASSKSCMELIANCYRQSYLQTQQRTVAIATARTSNAVGGGDNHTDSRLVPQLLAGFAKGEMVQLRNPNQTRPWQDVMDVVNGYLTLARFMEYDPVVYSGAYNIGPTLDGIKEVKWIVEKLQSFFEGAKAEAGEPLKVKESATLGVSVKKMLDKTDWQPERTLEQTLYYTVDYFHRQRNGEDERDIILSQVGEYYQLDPME